MLFLCCAVMNRVGLGINRDVYCIQVFMCSCVLYVFLGIASPLYPTSFRVRFCEYILPLGNSRLLDRLD